MAQVLEREALLIASSTKSALLGRSSEGKTTGMSDTWSH